MIEISKDKKSPTFTITKTDQEGYHRQLSVTRMELIEIYDQSASLLDELVKETLF